MQNACMVNVWIFHVLSALPTKGSIKDACSSLGKNIIFSGENYPEFTGYHVHFHVQNDYYMTFQP